MTGDGGPEAFERAVAELDYPMLVVTAAADGERSGCLVGFASQCSMDPPLFMVWISDKNRTVEVARRATGLVVHLLSSADGDLAELFGSHTGHEVDKFARCRWDEGPGGAPVLAGCPRWFAGRVLDRTPTGDHVAFLLAPHDGRVGDWPGQLGFQAVRHLEPGHRA